MSQKSIELGVIVVHVICFTWRR